MVAKSPDRFGIAALAPLVFKPLRRMRGLSIAEMAKRMDLSERAYRDFENGNTGLQLPRILEFAEILRVDPLGIVGAFLLRKPQVAHDFAIHKFMLVQANAIDELDPETRTAVAAVDPLTALDAHLQFYAQLAKYGQRQLRAGRGRRSDES